MHRRSELGCCILTLFGLIRAQLAQMLAETEWGDKSKRYFLNREEEHVGGLKAATAIWSVAVHT